MKLYVASSWRNTWQPAVVQTLKIRGYDVYDFRHPSPDDPGFAWSDIDRAWKEWTPLAYTAMLNHPIAQLGFGKDYAAMVEADACVLVLPCGRSAHLEAGYFVGAKKPLLIFYPFQERMEPELMYLMADRVVTTFEEVELWLSQVKDEVED